MIKKKYKSLKDAHVFGVIGACAIVLLLVIFNSPSVSESPSLQVSLAPASQLAQVTPSATLTLSPSTATTNTNNTFTVNIMLNTGGQATYGVDINKIHFNPAFLQVVDADSTAAGVQIAPGTLMSQVFTNTVDNTAGTIQFSQVANPGSTYNSSGILATITFRQVAAGPSSVTFDFTSGSGTDSNVAGLSGDLLASVGTGTYTGNTPDTTAPSTPGTPALTVQSSTAINLTWTGSTDNVAVTGYKLERCSGASCSTFAQIAAPTTPSYSDTGLTASTNYSYRVRATDAAGNNSSYSVVASATTQAPPDVTPPTISNITISAVTTTGSTIGWGTNENADTQVDYGLTTAYGLSTTLNSTLTNTHSAAISGLSPGTTYHYRVKSRDAAGNLATSPDNTFTTTAGPDTTAPSVPAGVTATPTNETSVQLSWTASTDPAAAGQNVSGVANYQVFRGGVLVATAPSASYLDTGLTGGTTYSYQITAVDVAGNISAKSTLVSATTPTLSLAVQRRVILSLDGAPATKRNVSGTIEYLNPANGAKVYTANITTDSLGKVVMDVPSGLIATVNMRALVPGYLGRILNTVDLRNSTILDLNFPLLPAGDFNNDGLINTLDFSYMNTNWNGTDQLADINRDGIVNSLDFAFLSNNWLLAGQ